MSAKILELSPLMAGTGALKPFDRVKVSLQRVNLSKSKKLILGMAAVGPEEYRRRVASFLETFAAQPAAAPLQ